MLVVSRKKSEVIKIGDDIEIMIVAIEDSQVRVGIEAPADVQVHRKEVYDAIQNGDE